MSALKVKMEAKRLEADYPLLTGFIKAFWNFGLVEEDSTFTPFVDWYFPSLPKDWAERFVQQADAARTDKALHAFFGEDSKARDCVDWMWGVCLMKPEDFTIIHEAAKRNYEAGNWRRENPTHMPMWGEPHPRRQDRR